LPNPQATPGSGGIYAAAGNYSTFIFSSRFSGGGSLPSSGISPVTPQPTPQDYPAASPAADLVMLQHTYAANTDIDLAPHVSSPGNTYGSDNFTSGPINYWSSPLNNQPASGTGLPILPEEGSNLGSPATNDPGWAFEDHNYLLWPEKWFVDSDLNGNFGPGDIDIAETIGYVQNDSRFENPRSTSGITTPDLEVQPLRMTCNFGATITPTGFNSSSVRSLLVSDLEAEPLETGPPNAGASVNLHYSLTTNPFAQPTSN